MEKLIGDLVFGNKELGVGILPYQRELLEIVLEGKHKILLHVGGQRSGKTYAGARYAWIWALRYKALGWIVTPIYKTAEVAREEFENACPHPKLISSYNKLERTYKLINGSRIDIRTADEPDHLRGPAPKWIWLDEGAQISHDCWKILRGRIVSTDGYILITTTPIGTNWLFHDVYLKCGNNPLYYCVTSTMRGNPTLPQNQVDDMYASFDERYVMQELEGRFITFKGQVYDCFRDERHIFLDLPKFKEGQIIHGVGGIDFGWEDPSAYLFGIYVKGEGEDCLYLLDEIYEPRLLGEDFANAIKELEAPYKKKYRLEHILRFADPHNTGYIHELRKRGLSVAPAPGTSGRERLIDQIQNVYSWIEMDRVKVRDTLMHFKKEINLYQFQDKRDKNIGNMPKDAYNHLMDCLRYMILGMEKNKVRLEYSDTDWGERLRMQRFERRETPIFAHT